MEPPTTIIPPDRDVPWLDSLIAEPAHRSPCCATLADLNRTLEEQVQALLEAPRGICCEAGVRAKSSAKSLAVEARFRSSSSSREAGCVAERRWVAEMTKPRRTVWVCAISHRTPNHRRETLANTPHDLNLG